MNRLFQGVFHSDKSKDVKIDLAFLLRFCYNIIEINGNLVLRKGK